MYFKEFIASDAQIKPLPGMQIVKHDKREFRFHLFPLLHKKQENDLILRISLSQDVTFIQGIPNISSGFLDV